MIAPAHRSPIPLRLLPAIKPEPSRSRTPDMTHMSDLLQVSKLETQFYSDPEYTQHVQYVSGSTTRQRKVRKEEKWMRERGLGRGSFGIVWLERCIQGDSEGKVRAVKKVEKLKSSDYYRELEAIALFSHSKYERCFVKSFGWYDNSDSIFITMEYLPDGDLQKYLGSPLSEKEGQQIVSQIVEGLHFMHDKGFAHRDLKPANILIVHKGPDWWVKIADFGISKRATEGLTALRTLTGTPAFAAPEVLGFIQSNDRLNDSYTNAVDIWSLGVITFLILTGETLFKDQRRLGQYAAGTFKFPLNVLLANKVSEQGCDFIKRSMVPKSEDRLRAKECLQHPWVDLFIEDATLHTQREFNISNSMPTPLDDSDPEPSASWSTQDTILNYKAHSSAGVLAEKAKSASIEAIALSTSEPAIQVYWHATKLLKGHLGLVNIVTFSPDGKQIASASSDETIMLWDSATGEPRNMIKGHWRWDRLVTFSPNGKQIVSAAKDNTIMLSDLVTGKPCNILNGHWGRVTGVTFSPDEKQIASASYDKTVRLWDSATGEPCNILIGHSDSVWAVTFSPDGKQIASVSSDQTIRLWDSATGEPRNILKGHSDWIQAVTFSPDGKQIASASHDKTIRLWDSATGEPCNILKGHSDSVWAVTFSPDGKQIASVSSDETIRLWDSATGEPRNILKGHSTLVNAVTFSPDGKQIASASYGTVMLWDSATGELRNILKKHSDWVSAVVFSPDGKQIASASSKNIILWNSTTEAPPPAPHNKVSKYLKKIFK